MNLIKYIAMKKNLQHVKQFKELWTSKQKIMNDMSMSRYKVNNMLYRGDIVEINVWGRRYYCKSDSMKRHIEEIQNNI